MGDMSYIRDLNVFIEELNKIKENNPRTDEIYENIVKDFNNTIKDNYISRGLDDLNELLDLSELSEKERRQHTRQNEINIYYQKRYERQIVILQKVILLFCLGILGTLLPDSLRPLGIGSLFAIGFIVVFYDLWDVYIRDSRDFDQYNYNIFYSNPPDTDTSYFDLDINRDKDTKYC
jgi:uncharacterized membrane protein